eukprot:4668287-Pleurochrysis_carterae.AAC.2
MLMCGHAGVWTRICVDAPLCGRAGVKAQICGRAGARACRCGDLLVFWHADTCRCAYMQMCGHVGVWTCDVPMCGRIDVQKYECADVQMCGHAYVCVYVRLRGRAGVRACWDADVRKCERVRTCKCVDVPMRGADV